VTSIRQERPGTGRLAPAQLAALGAGVVAGLVVWQVGLPDDPVWDTTWAALTVPAALVVGAGVGVVAIAASTRRRWRVVDLTVAAVLAVAGGLLLWGMNTAWTPLTTPVSRLYPPLPALLNGVWLLPGVLAGLVVRRPGAALLGETVAALIEAQLGGLWGFASVYYGVVEGLGAELVFALLLYRRFGLGAAMAAGAGSGVALALLDLTFYFTDYPAGQKLAYVVLSVLSGAGIAGAGGWALTRALATTGALAPLASGREAERV
jgi:energy-coupling factor transport system substrate-specific component